MEWTAPTLGLLQEVLPSTELAITSQQSPDLADGLMRGRLDMAFLRPEKNAPGLVYRMLRQEPLIVLMPAGHVLTAKERSPLPISPAILWWGVPASNSPALRAATDRYATRTGIDLTPDHEALNLAMAISLIASTGGLSLLPLYARNLLPLTVVSRPPAGMSRP